MVRTDIGPGPGKYILPPLVGYKDHDATKYRNPQYSMGLKLPLYRKDFGPGPKYHTQYLTNYGKANPPAYSIASRPQTHQTFDGPGPAAYNIKSAPQPPAYSMSFRHTIRQTSETPGPNSYEIPTTIGPKVPDKPANGAFSISNRYPISTKEGSPGPAKYEPTNPNVYKNKPPAYSMSIKPKDIGQRGTYPSPSDYYPKLPGKGGFSFGLKTDLPPFITPEDEMPCIKR